MEKWGCFLKFVHLIWNDSILPSATTVTRKIVARCGSASSSTQLVLSDALQLSQKLRKGGHNAEHFRGYVVVNKCVLV